MRLRVIGRGGPGRVAGRARSDRAEVGADEAAAAAEVLGHPLLQGVDAVHLEAVSDRITVSHLCRRALVHTPGQELGVADGRRLVLDIGVLLQVLDREHRTWRGRSPLPRSLQAS